VCTARLPTNPPAPLATVRALAPMRSQPVPAWEPGSGRPRHGSRKRLPYTPVVPGAVDHPGRESSAARHADALVRECGPFFGPLGVSARLVRERRRVAVRRDATNGFRTATCDLSTHHHGRAGHRGAQRHPRHIDERPLRHGSAGFRRVIGFSPGRHRAPGIGEARRACGSKPLQAEGRYGRGVGGGAEWIR
jgi:hypothetical protein